MNDASYVVCERAYSGDSTPIELREHDEYWNTTTHAARGGTLEVPSTDLREICDHHAISTFSLVMDIEGAEYDLFGAELELLEARCSFLVVEFHEEGPHAEAYDDDLEDSAFELVEGIESVCVYRNTRLSNEGDADDP